MGEENTWERGNDGVRKKERNHGAWRGDRENRLKGVEKRANEG